MRIMCPDDRTQRVSSGRALQPRELRMRRVRSCFAGSGRAGGLCKQFVDNESFKRWMADTGFRLTYDQKQSGP